MKMSYIAKKRIKLAVCLISIPLTIFLISFSMHTIFLTAFVKTEVELLSGWYRDIVHKKIQEPSRTPEERKLLWSIADAESIREIDVSSILDVTMLFYIIVSILVAIPCMILVKWYTVDSENLVISTEEEKLIKRKALKE